MCFSGGKLKSIMPGLAQEINRQALTRLPAPASNLPSSMAQGVIGGPANAVQTGSSARATVVLGGSDSDGTGRTADNAEGSRRTRSSFNIQKKSGLNIPS